MLQLVSNKLTKVLAFLSLSLFIQISVAESIGGIIEQSGDRGSIVRLSGEELTAELETSIVSFDEVETTK